jgi:hypothetical protein
MKAPKPKPGEHPVDFIERVVSYLTVPERRRMGEETASDVRAALEWLKRSKP